MTEYKENEIAGRNIFLIGFMGSGKTTVANYLSKTYGMQTEEMDNAISRQEGMSISDIFAVHGEAYFRGLETELLIKMQKKENIVVSCGGGVPMREENVAEMKKSGSIILLKASPETIYERVKDNHERPLLEGNKNIAYISELMEKRREKYEAAADFVVDTDGKKISVIAQEIMQKLSKWNRGDKEDTEKEN